MNLDVALATRSEKVTMTNEVATTHVGVSFFGKVKLELTKLFAHAPSWEASAAATLTYVAPMVETILTLADPAVAPVVDATIAKVQAAMAAASVVIKAAGPTPTLVKYLNAINDDLAMVEEASGVKDPETAAKLTALVAGVTAEVNAILSATSTAKQQA